VAIVPAVATIELKETARPMRQTPTTFSAAVAVTIVLAIAGCGSGAGSLATGTTGASDTPKLLTFAHCMRAHSVPDFPDPGGARPSGSGVSILGIALPPTIDVKSPAFQAAMRACQNLATGGAPHAGVTEAEKQAALRYSRCMRARGLPNYPDPVFRNGHIGIRPGPGDNPNSPAFLAAAKACGNA
jgi:hypothetical protein